MSVSFTVYDDKFKRELDTFAKKAGKQFQDAVTDATLKMHKLAVNKAPVDDKGLRGGIKFNIINKGFTGEVISGQNYSEAVEEGTRPHKIRIKTKRVLAGAYRKRPGGWNVSESSKKAGYATYGKEVQHPGTKAQPFMEPAFKVGRKTLMKKISDVFK